MCVSLSILLPLTHLLVESSSAGKVCHEEIRVLSQQAAEAVKLRGEENDLVERIRKSNYFAPIHDQLDFLLDPLTFVGRAPQRVRLKNKKLHRIEDSKFCRLFQTWTSDSNLCKIMDISILLDNMNGEEPYLNTGQFFMDVKWIYHNCFILYGPDSNVTENALKMEKSFRQELTDMEACPQCYFTKYKDEYLHADFFTNVCVCHDEIRVLSQQAAEAVKLRAEENDLVERIRKSNYFAPIHDQLDFLLEPITFVGRAPQQVTEFLEEEVFPVIAPYKDMLDVKAVLKV